MRDPAFPSPSAAGRSRWIRHGERIPIDGQGGEGEIREGLIRDDVVDCIVALSPQLFYTRSSGLLRRRARPRRRSRHLRASAPYVGAHAGESRHRPRHSFVSLLTAEGHSSFEIARQAGHSPKTALNTCAHVFDEFGPAVRVAARRALVRAPAWPGALRRLWDGVVALRLAPVVV